MAKLSKDFKESIKKLSETEKEKIIFKFATKHQAIYEQLSMLYLKEKAEENFMEITRQKISDHLNYFEGKNPQQALSKAITLAIREITALKKITKNKTQEIELGIFLLETVFIKYGEYFGTNYRTLDTKVANFIDKTITLIYEHGENELIHDYKVSMDRFLEFIKQTSNFVDAVYALPKHL